MPEPEAFYCMPDEVEKLRHPSREDNKLRILTQSDPYVSRFIWEVRSILDRGWYLPVFKGVDPIGKVLMFKVNDYLKSKIYTYLTLTLRSSVIHFQPYSIIIQIN